MDTSGSMQEKNFKYMKSFVQVCALPISYKIDLEFQAFIHVLD